MSLTWKKKGNKYATTDGRFLIDQSTHFATLYEQGHDEPIYYSHDVMGAKAHAAGRIAREEIMARSAEFSTQREALRAFLATDPKLGGVNVQELAARLYARGLRAPVRP